MIDLSSLFQTTSYPVSPIAQFLQIAYQARQAKQQRQEAEAERKRREERYQLQLGQARRTEAQAEERTRFRAMRLGDVLPNIRAEFKDWTVGRLEDMGIPLAQVIDDPRAEAERRRAEARQAVEDAQLLAKAGRRTTVPGATVETAFPGVTHPRLPGPFADIPGVSPQGVGVPTIPGAQPPIYRGPVTPMEFGVPAARRTYGEAFPAEVLKPGWTGMVIPVDSQGNEQPATTAFRLEATPERPEAPHARRERVTNELHKLIDNIRASISSGLPQDAVAAARAFNARKAEATKWGVAIPYPSYDLQGVARQATDRKRKLEREPRAGGTEGLTPAQKRIVDQYNRIDSLAEKAQDKLDDPMMTAETPQAKSLQDRIAAYNRQQAAILRRYPWIGRYVGEEPAPESGWGPGGGLGGELPAQAIEFIQQAVEQRVPLAQVLAWARQAGLNPQQVEAQYKRLTIPQQRTSAAPAVPVRPQQRTVSLAQVQTEARRRGVHPNLVVQEYNRRGIMVQ